MFQVNAIQAEQGDALLVSYGEASQPRHLLIDGGPAGTESTLVDVLKHSRTEGRLRLEVLVITHYDLDHIEGVIGLLQNKPDWLEIADIWFNGFHHLRSTDRLGPSEGDTLSDLISAGGYPWNDAFGRRAIQQNCDPVHLEGGLQVSVLSPDATSLASLANYWTDPRCMPDKSSPPRDLLGRSDPWPPGSYEDASTSTFKRDTSPANGSSIALLLEFERKRVLLAADAFAHVVEAALRKHFSSKPEIHLLKVAHHGSKANTNYPLLNSLKCRRFLISTSGKGHGHPDNALIARLLRAHNEPEIFFNYAVEYTARWGKPLQGWPSFSAVYPADGERFVRIDV
ncbi:ComEC/Rec2 family competence protein [Chromobacterium subtsugae]|uniref:ComEC/Rec2 family competence protein n=1 Tax=Chromobacterium subtsugae TaxID=251747 RepID=UPI000640BC1C|nr:MBL fold metallo-hydrolase [Chromobacterium subtsugae]